MKMSDYIPQGVVMDILIRLPIRSLLKFRCVSKSWNSLITSPLFIITHLKKSTLLSQTNPVLLVRCRPNPATYHYSLRFDDDCHESFDQYLQLATHTLGSVNMVHVVGSSNGVVCLLDDSQQVLVLWNPLIRKELTLPSPNLFALPYGLYMSVFGFGFDSQNDDYKVVRILNVERMDFLEENNFPLPAKAELYSHNLGSWRSIDVNLGSFGMGDFQGYDWNKDSALLNGAVHWIVRKRFNGGMRNLVLSFDLSSELFEELMLPESLATRCRIVQLRVSVAEKSLAVFHRCGNFCDVWLMKEYGVVESWMRRYSFEPRDHICCPIVVGNNGKVLMMTDFQSLISYDPQSQAYNDLGIFAAGGGFRADSFVESLVLLNDRRLG